MIMRRMNITGLLLLLTLIPFYIPDLSAQTYVTEQRETLRGLKGLQVVIENITQAGLTKSLKTDVELKLRKAGIRVLTRITATNPFLYVNVTVMQIKSPDGFIYTVRVSFLQDVILSRNRSIKTKCGNLAKEYYWS